MPREERMKKIVFALTALSLVAGSAPALAAPCKDAKGKFIKCPAPVAKAVAKSTVAVAQKSTVKTKVSSKQCRDAKGRFAKCK